MDELKSHAAIVDSATFQAYNEAMKKNQAGFSLLEAILIIIILIVVGFAGWYVWHKQQRAEPSKVSTGSVQKQSTNTTKPYQAPEGYTLYENKELGFSFAHPKEYGSVSKQPDLNGVQILKSAEPSAAFGPGISGTFQVFTYGTADQAITGHKYGPQVRLQNGKWIVTQTNEADMASNKVGDEYKDAKKNPPLKQTNEGLAIYTFISSDEGSESDRLVFVAKNKLHEIHLPAFYDGLSTGNDTPNDKAAFNKLLSTVRDSIRLTE